MTRSVPSVPVIKNFLRSRGLIKAVTNETKLIAAIRAQKAVYCGFDPTATSLHIGHFLPLYVLKQFFLWNCPVIVVLGGMTGQIGDPSFRTKRRVATSSDFFITNTKKISAQLQMCLPFAKIVNNLTWYETLPLPTFFAQVGKLFTVNKLLEKESIARAYTHQGLFFDELSYLLLQAYDFYHLFQTEDCHIQIGGSDQFPNITLGLDLIAKLLAPTPAPAAGLTLPLVTIKARKISKTDRNFLPLDASSNTLYAYYQFFVNLPDEDAQTWQKWLNLRLLATNSLAAKLKIASAVIKTLFPLAVQTQWQRLLSLLAKPLWTGDDFPQLEPYFRTLVVKSHDHSLTTLLLTNKLFPSYAALKRTVREKSLRVNNLQVAAPETFFFRAMAQQQLAVVKHGKKIILIVKY